MAERIFRNLLLTVLLAVLLTAAVIVPSLYTVHEDRLSRELRQEADIIAGSLEMAQNDTAWLESLTTDSRLTLIDPDGTVLYDSAADAAKMENHAERPEVAQALENGRGENIRTSSTLAQTTIYYAVRTGDGCVLRISNTRSSMLGTFLGVLPLIAGMLLCLVIAALVIAKGTAGRIVRPINGLNLDQPLENEAYDELAPLLTRMHQQNMQIQSHVQALENARAELTAIMENMSEGMILLDGSCTVLSMNQSAGRIFDVDAGLAVGKNLLSVNRDADLSDMVHDALRGENGRLTIQRSGRYYHICASPVLKNQAVCGTALFVLDVTDRFAAEASRREFTANVSHELKTPLTAISGIAEIIRDGIAKPQDIQHFAGMICRESARLIALVNDILKLSQLDEMQNLGQKETVALMPLLRGLTDDFSIAAQKKNLTLTLSGDDAEIEGHPVLLNEMFFNLIDNAVKYTPEGGSIAVTIENKESSVICRVADNGIGIGREHQSHIFERFYRADKSHSRQTGGTGLGLAIVKHIAQIHKADACVTSEEGKGACFTVTFDR